MTGDDVRNLEETADFFGVSLPTVRGWLRDGAPIIEGGSNGVPYRLSLRAIKGWLDDREAAEAAERAAKAEADAQLRMELLGGESLAETEAAGLTPEQRRAALDAEIKAVRLGRERGELVRFEDVRSALATALAAVTAHLRAMPDRLAPLAGWDDDVTAAAQREVEAVLHDLADELEGVPEAGLDAGARHVG